MICSIHNDFWIHSQLSRYVYSDEYTSKETTTTESTDTYTYDAASRILTTVKGRHNVTTEHTYALDGLPLTETLIADNRTYLSTRTYDAANRPLTHTFPSGETTHWAYDARNLVTTVHYQDKLITTNTHDDGYRLTHQTFGNGLQRNINYNRLDNLRSTDSLQKNTQTIDDLTMIYQYAHDKQIAAEQIAGDLLPSSGFTSSYDAGNRLTNWQRGGGFQPPSQQTWNYDDAGNWNSTAKTIGTNTTTEARTHSAADQINTIAGNAATHDLKGNLTEYEQNGKEYTVTYDLDNRIITADVDNNDVEYRYDAFGRRVIRKEGSTTTSLIWWGNSECAEHKHQAGQTVIQNDIFEHPSRLNSVIARAIDGSKFKLQWYHKNYLDHVYAVSDDSGDILEHYRYTAFGEVTIYDQNGNLQNTTQIDNHILWNTRRRDEVTGFYMYKFRHYSPELGRWPSRDPIEEAGGVNLYAFVGNDGINGWDRLGLELFHYFVCHATAKLEIGHHIEYSAFNLFKDGNSYWLADGGKDYKGTGVSFSLEDAKQTASDTALLKGKKAGEALFPDAMRAATAHAFQMLQEDFDWEEDDLSPENNHVTDDKNWSLIRLIGVLKVKCKEYCGTIPDDLG